MLCPSCNTQNQAMTVRCLKCGSTLIHEAVGHSDDYKAAARNLDYRMYSGYGGLIGAALGWGLSALIPEVFQDAKLFATLGTGLGVGIGRFLAWKNWKDL